jgi:hypothetical protein
LSSINDKITWFDIKKNSIVYIEKYKI